MSCDWCSKPGCRFHRPRCRWARASNPKTKPCWCDGYHYPHRPGSPLCKENPKCAENMYREMEKKGRR
jgi:hypothetical protein